MNHMDRDTCPSTENFIGDVDMALWGPLRKDKKNLTVIFDENNWYIEINRIDNKPCEMFKKYSGKRAFPSELKEFLPNWNSLAWHPSSLSKSKGLSSRDGDINVRLLTTEESSLSNEQIVEKFKRFMADKGE